MARTIDTSRKTVASFDEIAFFGGRGWLRFVGFISETWERNGQTVPAQETDLPTYSMPQVLDFMNAYQEFSESALL
jgi:hypothetical protein